MGKISCSSCGSMTDSRELKACRNCDGFMCPSCYGEANGFCQSCRQFTLS